jgi:hypothetical protein
MNNKKPLPAIVIFAIITTVTAFVWVGFEAIRTFTKKPSPSVPTEVSAQLDPTLDPDALSKLVQRLYLEESEIGQTQIIDLSTLQPEGETEESQPLPEAEEEVPEEATESSGVQEASEEADVTQ